MTPECPGCTPQDYREVALFPWPKVKAGTPCGHSQACGCWTGARADGRTWGSSTPFSPHLGGACFMPMPQGPEAGASARQSPGLGWLVCLDPGLSAQRPRRGSLLPWIISRALAPFSSRDPRAQRGPSSRSERLGLWPRAGLPRVQLSRLLPGPAPTAPGAPRGPSWTRRTCSWKPGTRWSRS